MAATEYTYSVTSDFPNQKVNIPRLTQEIDDSEITVKLADDGISVVADTCSIWFMAALDGSNKSTLDTIVANHSGEPLASDDLPVALKNVALDADSQIQTTQYPRESGETRIIYTPNFADATTWYQESQRISGDTLSTSDPEKKVFYASQGQKNWIDATHGKLSHEDEVLPDKTPYVPVVYIDDEPAVEKPPFELGGAYDYEIDYADGKVTFLESQDGKVITADFSYATSAKFTFGPSSGKILKIERSEIQYSADIKMNGTFKYAPYAYNPEGPPVPKIPVGAPHVYKTLKDFVTEANGVYPIHPACPNPNGRGLGQNHINAPFDYGTVRTLRSSYGVEIQIEMDPDVACDGEFAEMTFYCMEFDES